MFDHTDPLITDILRKLVKNLEIDDDVDEDDDKNSRQGFDARDFVEDLLDAVMEGLANDIVPRGNAVRCIRRVLRELIDRNVVRRLSSQLQQIRRGITALMRISRFLRNQKSTLDDVNILKRCFTRLIELSYCQRCTDKTPPLCFRTCNAVARACYSPYFTALNGQYRELWERVQNIVRALNGTLSDLFDGERALLDKETVVSPCKIQCLKGVSP